MKPKPRLQLAAAFLALATLAISCSPGGGGTQGPPITLTIWKPFVSSDNLQPIIQDYTQQYPNVTINYVERNFDSYQNDLLNALAAGAGPDIFSIENDWLPQYLNKITASPDKYFMLKDYKDTFVDAMVNDFTRDGKIYGTALGVDSLALYYNKDLLGSAGIARPPQTWDELSKDVQKLRRQDRSGYFQISGVAMGGNSNVNRAVDIVYLLMLQAGVTPWSQDKLTPTFGATNNNNQTPGATALNFYTSFANPTSTNYNWNARSDYSIDAFANGRAALLYSYSHTRDTILQKAPNLNFDVAPAPQRTLNGTSVNYADYFGEVVSKQSKNSAWAWHFLKFITSKKELDKYYAATRQPSGRKDLIELQINDPDIGVFANANLTAKSFYKPDQVKIDSIFTRLIDNVILRGLSVDDALAQAQDQASAVVQP